MRPISRRATLLGLGSTLSFGPVSLAFAAAVTEQRFVVVLLRGALDGLAAVQPYGDKALRDLRADLALPEPGQDKGLLDLGGFHGLHPALSGLHGLYKANELAIVHAVASSTRSRSHFDAQDYLEYGAERRMNSGWLNRATALLPTRPGGSETALSVGTSVALLLRGPAPVGAWLPQSFGRPDPGLYRALAALHTADPITGPALAQGLHERGFTEAVLNGTEAPNDKFSFPALCTAAGKLLAAPDGPRIAALEVGGWDTHVAQKARLPGVLGALDKGISGLKEGLGPAWSRTAVLVMTEFGRTVRTNGTNGTDHGTGSVAFLAGGAIAGGRVLGTWPGLAPANLFQNRDLTPTTDLRSLAKGLLSGHFKLPASRLADVFPDSAAAPPLIGLLRA
jgi:uncharacterized protein (DUF1501 family)